MISVRIDVKKVDKNRLYKGEKGTYMDLTCYDKPDEYGNDGYVTQRLTRSKNRFEEHSASH